MIESNNLVQKEHGFLNRNALKYFAIVCMLVDHIAGAFLEPTSMIGRALEFLGGFTMPIMAFFLAEGYRYTRDLKRYATRLLVFALISVIPFCYDQTGIWLPIGIVNGHMDPHVMNIYLSSIDKSVFLQRFNFLFTLLFSLLNIAAWDKLTVPVPVKVLITTAICWIASGGDWGYWCVLISFIFWRYREKPALKWTLYSLVALSCVFYFKVFQNPLCFDVIYSFRKTHLNLFLVIPIIAFFYNGKKGKGGKFGKWFFYLFYPVHLLIIDLVLLISSNHG